MYGLKNDISSVGNNAGNQYNYVVIKKKSASNGPIMGKWFVVHTKFLSKNAANLLQRWHRLDRDSLHVSPLESMEISWQRQDLDVCGAVTDVGWQNVGT